MIDPSPLKNCRVAVSISDSAELDELGLSKNHLIDAMAEVARHLLALGAGLVYGGDLRSGGFTDLLFELALRYRSPETAGAGPTITNYLPWPVHAPLSNEEINNRQKELTGAAQLICLSRGGEPIRGARTAADLGEPNANDWESGLTAMRHTLTALTNARIVLGGKLTGFRGRYPGIAEETIYSLQAGQPVFILGGFGGAARKVVQAIGLADSGHLKTSEQFDGLNFDRYGPESVNNRLSVQENKDLAKTVHVDEMIVLILKGLLQTHPRLAD